jgi:hypothetical protein
MSTTLTGEVIAEALRQAGLEVQYFPWVPKPGEARTPHTVGSFSLDKLAAAVNVHLASLALPPAQEEPDPVDEIYRAAAIDQHYKEGELEIDDDAKVSHGDDRGAYVAAWVWVDEPEGVALLDAAARDDGSDSMTATHLPGDPLRALEVDISEGGHCD